METILRLEDKAGVLQRARLDNRIRMYKKLKLPQRVTLMVIFLFNFQLLEYLPLKIGPLTQTMLIELIAFAVVFPRLHIYIRHLNRRDKRLFFVCFCMFVLAFFNLSGGKGESQQKAIFTSIFAYFFVVSFFSGRPEYGIWLRRLHLIPALATINLIGATVFAPTGWTGFDARIGANEAAVYLAMLLPICWVQFNKERGFFRFLNLFILGVTPLVLVVSASRTAFVVLIVVATFMLVAEKPAKKLLILAASLILFMTTIFFLPKQNLVSNRILSLRNPISALEVDRIGLWKAALLSITENPLLGGDFRANVHRLVIEADPESNYAKHIRAGASGINLGVHNGYLAVMAHFGLIVAFLYFSYFISLGKALSHTRQRIRNAANRSFLFAGLVSLIGYAIGNITLHIYMGQQFFIIWAILQCSIKNSILIEKKQRNIEWYLQKEREKLAL